jgi:Cu(I)/Ag(I) efflux system membrane fusion protein
MTEIRKGLQAGQRVVVSGQFLIDSEASLKTTVERMNAPEAEAPARAAEGAVQKGEAQAPRKERNEPGAKGSKPGAKMGDKP